MLNLLCLTALSLSIGATRYQNDAATASGAKERCDVVDFISADFRTFVDKYNEYHIEKFEAQELVRTKDLYAVDFGDGYYFDFDKGFMVATEKYEILAISNVDPYYEDDLFDVDGPLVYTGTSFKDSFGFEFGLDAESIPVLDGALISDQNNSLELATSSLPERYSNGVSADEIDDYISDYYSDYSVVTQKFMEDYDYVSQFDTSVYIRKFENNASHSEGNCTINAAYSMLHNMGKKLYDKKFYYNDYYVDYSDKISNDAHHSLRDGVDGWERNDRKRSGNPRGGYEVLKNMPNLYLRLRDKAINYDYSEEDGMAGTNIWAIISDIRTLYGYDDLFAFYARDITYMQDSIDNNIPCIIATTNSKIYKNHAMAVNGYMKLRKTVEWWVFDSTHTAYILSVDDGHENSCVDGNAEKRKYYDTSLSQDNLYTCVDKESLEYSGC